jgi:uncharacterized protein (DUF362 family)
MNGPPRDRPGARCPRRAVFELGAGLAAAAVTGCRRAPPPPDEPPPPPVPPSTHAAPKAPGRVLELHHPGSLGAGGVAERRAVSAMIERGLVELCGAPDATAAWRRFFAPGDVVGIKVNPVGKATDRKRRTVVTSPEAIATVVDGLRRAGIAPADILLFDRYRQAFMDCGYHEHARALGVRWEASAVDYDETQLDLAGYSAGDPEVGRKHARARGDGSPRVSGYDPEVSFTLDVVHPQNDPQNPRSRRSHLSTIVSRRVNKIVNLCVLKDHSSAGVTGALKNMSHGFFDNVSRTHARPDFNHCGPFIPTAVALPQVRDKVVLHVMEALAGIYQGGPSASLYAWEPRSILVATDPVALDRVAWDLLDARRAQEGLLPLSRAGRQAIGTTPGRSGKPLEAFDRRAPEHIEEAARRGLGVCARTLEEWRRIAGAGAGTPAALLEVRRLSLG